MSEISIKPAKIVGTGSGQVVYLKNPEEHLLDPTRNGYRVIGISPGGDKIRVRRDDEIDVREFYPEDLTNEKPRKKFKVGDRVTEGDVEFLPKHTIILSDSAIIGQPGTVWQVKSNDIIQTIGSTTKYNDEGLNGTILWLPVDNNE